MSDVWSILYLITKDVGLYSLCLLSFILTHLISSTSMPSCLGASARLVLARFSPHGHMSGWPFRNFLKLSPSPRHNVFIKRDRALIRFWDSIHWSNWLSEVTNVELHDNNQWCVFHFESILLLKEQIIVFLETRTFLFKCFSKLFSSILLFVQDVADTMKSEALIDEEDKNAKIVNSIKIYEIVNFFLDDQSIFRISNFEFVEEITIMINMHSLNETLFSEIQSSFVLIVFRDIEKFFRTRFEILD
jgi:hypothetical protein